MDNHLSATRFVDTLPVVEVQQIRARVFLAEFDTDFESVRSVLDTLPSTDPDVIWEARLGRPTKVLILRGRNRPRHRALKDALRGARLFLFKGRPSHQTCASLLDQRAFRG